MRLSLVRHEDRDVAAHVLAEGIDPAARLRVYRNTFASVLTRALRLSYPAVGRLVGAGFFEGSIRAFIEEQPPRSACLDDYGAGLADFLACFAPAAPLEYLRDVAQLEWAVNRALHGPDAEPLDTARLVALTEDEQARVRFAPHPSVSLVRADYPADSIWRAVLAQDDAALAAIDPAKGPVRLLVHRAAAGVDVSRLGEGAWHLTAALFAGRPLHQALEEARFAEAQALLAEHLAAERFAGFSLDDCFVATSSFQ
jgi:hypothetical protein